ncbi:AMP-dependent synthetase/ligase [Cryptosporangium arvum]|uniref:Acyl-CoA synthetase n=1 Tax=Cryptosporangium arvum DSM 44712 TaxID=927661 RepID=A0A011AFS6_9ACTN|nr:long-chain fatty acid--CoA ligase [Cryptosporangium arvum]EXG80881.1 AMP-forming long-chain acyl-CoA synthetase [Cryptosporangium arvum DSM 44712]
MREFAQPAVYTVPDGANLTDPVWSAAEEVPDKVTFRRPSGGGWTDVTAATFRDEVVGVAKGLIASGIQPGDRIGLMARTRYEWTLVDYAIWAAGAVTVPIYETSSAEQVQWILGDSGAVGVFVESSDHQSQVEAVRGSLPSLRQVWQIDASAVELLTSGGASVPSADVDERRAALGPADTATIIYTSGTTGRPKGCVLTHKNLLFEVGNALPMLPSMFNEGASTLLFLPLAHAFARLIQLGAVQSRATLGHAPDIKNLMNDLQTFRPTFVLAVPRVFEKVYNGAKQKAHKEGKGAIFDRADRVAVAYSEALDSGGPGLLLRAQHAVFDKLVYAKLRAALGGSCTHAISGGAPLGPRLAHFFRGIGLWVSEGYGLTETSPATAANVDDAVKLGTVGRPLPGMTVRIADDGEVLIAGDHVFSEYWHNPDATAEALKNGFFHTGDLGTLDDEGFLTITGRKKELIVTAAGKNVAPAVLEDRIRAHALVSQAMVVGDGKPFIGAVVTVDPDAFGPWKDKQGKPADATVGDLAEDPELRAEIQAAVDDANQAVSRAEQVKVFRILPRDFTEETGELTPSMKLKRSVVEKEYADEIAAIYT